MAKANKSNKPKTLAEEADQQLRRPAPPRDAAKPGRPKGAATSHEPGTHAVKPMCCACGSSSLKRKAVLSDVRLPTPHVDPLGNKTTHRRITRVQCEKCTKWQPLVEFYNL
jgi:hypothetical protein